MASAICPNCHILLVEANTSSLSNMSASVNEAVALGATEISNSWGSGEFSEEKDFESAFHHPGIPITAASGDAGYDNYKGGGSTAELPRQLARRDCGGWHHPCARGKLARLVRDHLAGVGERLQPV